MTIFSGEILNNRYQIEKSLGKNPGRETWLATDLKTEKKVVVKVLSFGVGFEWEYLKLFEREAKTLQNLSHPAIPEYLDYFEFDSTASNPGFALVQSYMQGVSLREQLEQGRTFSELQIRDLAKKVLEILVYLHNRQPPIIHRDLKPSNILLADNSSADKTSVGKVYLIDFGSVQNVAAQPGGTITIVGTYGYMPPEQFGGRTQCVSDIYSLGATLVNLITGVHPADLPQQQGKICLDSIESISFGFKAWLSRTLEPSLDLRFNSARVALQALESSTLSWSSRQELPSRPVGSKIKLEQPDLETIKITLPPAGFSPGLVYLIFFAIAWNSFIVFWTAGAVFIAPFPLSILFGLFSLPFWAAGVSMLAGIGASLWGKTQLTIDRYFIKRTFSIFGFKINRPRPLSRDFIEQITCIKGNTNQLIISAGNYQYRLGSLNKLNSSGATKANSQVNSFTSVYNLTEPEIKWLAINLSYFLNLPITYSETK